jgi:MFS family permease
MPRFLRRPADLNPRSLRVGVRRLGRDQLGIPRAARHSLGWDVWAGAFSGLYMGMTFPFFTKIARGELGSPEWAVSLMIAAPFIGNLFAPLWARQMEGRDKLPFVLISWVLARTTLLFMPFAFVGSVFVFLVSALQIIGTVSGPAYTALMKDIYPDHARGRLMGYVRVVAQTMMFVSTFAAGRLLDSGISYQYLFPIAGIFGFAAAYTFGRVRPLAGHSVTEMPKKKASVFLRETLGILKHNGAYRYFALSVFVYGLANLMVQPLFQLYQVDVLKINSTGIANLTNFASLCSIAGMFFWGRFMDRRGAPVAVMCSIVLIALIPIVYLATQSVNGLFVAAALSGFGFAGIELSYLASILLYSEPGRTAQYQSLHSLLLGVRGVLAPLIAVPLKNQFGYGAVFAGALIVMIIGALLQGLAIRAQRETSETA